MSEIKYKLSDRPKWWLPRLFKWLSIISLTMGMLAWVISEIIYSMFEEKFSPSLESGSATIEEKEFFLEGVSGRIQDVSSFFLELLFSVLFLWLVAIAVDKIDQLVWLAASDEDREEILKKRQKNAKNK